MLFAASVCLMLLSCSFRELYPTTESHDAVKVSFVLDVPVSKGVVSGMVSQNSGISCLKMAIYDEQGLIFWDGYYDGSETGNISAMLQQGCRYSAFVLANVGDFAGQDPFNENMRRNLTIFREHAGRWRKGAPLARAAVQSQLLEGRFQ